MSILELARFGVCALAGVGITVATNQSKMAGSYFARHPIAAGWGLACTTAGFAAWRAKKTLPRFEHRMNVHRALTSVGTMLFNYAAYVIWNCKIANKKKHCQTNHARVAFPLVVLCTAQLAAPMLMTLSPTMNRKLNNFMKKYHSKVGYVIYGLMVLTVGTGWAQTEILGKGTVKGSLGFVSTLALGAVSLI